MSKVAIAEKFAMRCGLTQRWSQRRFHLRSAAAGSFIFVPAGRIHRFENFSSDLTVWVVFYGPEGGEE
jgi:uncharacterized RmlC-like cupin family protein